MPPKSNKPKKQGQNQQKKTLPPPQAPLPQQEPIEPKEELEQQVEQFLNVKKERGAKNKPSKAKEQSQAQHVEQLPQSHPTPIPKLVEVTAQSKSTTTTTTGKPPPQQAKAKVKPKIELGIPQQPPTPIPKLVEVPAQSKTTTTTTTTTTSKPPPQQNMWGQGKDISSMISQVSISPKPPATTTTTTTTTTTPTTTTKPTTVSTPSTTTTTTSVSTLSIMEARKVKDEDAQHLAVRINATQSFPTVDLYVNQFLIKFNQKNLFQYQVEFAPLQETRSARKQCVDKVSSHFDNIFLYDGSAIVFSSKEVEDKSFHLDNGITISITKVSKFGPEDSKSMQFFNVLFKNFLRDLKLTMIGRQYYNSLLKKNIEKHGIEVWPGFFTSINLIQAGTSLLCDVAHKIVRTTSILEKILKMEKDQRSQNEINDSLAGSIIITKYNNRTYRVSCVRWNMKVTDRMSKDNPKTFKDYYESHYPKLAKITKLNQPLLEIKVKRAGQIQFIHIIPEYSYLTGLDDEITSDFHCMRELANQKFVPPPERKQKLEEFVGSLQKNTIIKKEMEKWGVSFSPSLPVKGGQLPNPTINFQINLLKGVKWVLIVSQRDQDEVMRFVDILRKESGLPEPRIVNPKHFNGKVYCEEIPNLKGYGFFFIVIQPKLYDEIKQTTLLRHKVITQCALPRTLSKGRPVAVKIYHQIAAKLGMSPWVLKNNNFTGIPVKKTMLIGIDVSHNTAIKNSSVVGFVASLNDDFSCFHTEAFLQNKSGKEIVDTLQPAIANSLQAYTKKNGSLPELIIVYRDGVGDGMINLVNQYEVAAVKAAINASPSIYGIKPKLVYTIVKKNTNTRLFRRENGDNPLPGTVVDQTCTRKGWYDFFLVSQKALQGSVNPTHYHIIHDEAKIPINDFQYFTYANCFLYYNFDKAVSVPAPCQYAHKLALLIGKNVHAPVSNELSSNLYFL